MVGPDIVTDNQTIVCYALNPDTTVSLSKMNSSSGTGPIFDIKISSSKSSIKFDVINNQCKKQ